MALTRSKWNQSNNKKWRKHPSIATNIHISQKQTNYHVMFVKGKYIMPYHTVHFIFTNPLHKNDPNYKVSYTSKKHTFLTVGNVKIRKDNNNTKTHFSNFL